MKYTLITLLLLCQIQLLAQLNIKDGKIGIGVTNPSQKVETVGAIIISYTDFFQPGTIRWTGTDFEGYNGTTWLSLTSNNPASSPIPLKTTSNITKVKNGAYGIGTDTPLQSLDVRGGIEIGMTLVGTPGTIRWTGADFEGFTGTEWKSLTQ